MKAKLLIIILSVCGLSYLPAQNLLVNGGFEEDLGGYFIGTASGVASYSFVSPGLTGDKALDLNVTEVATENSWDIQLVQENINAPQIAYYRLSFWAKSDPPASIFTDISDPDYASFINTTFMLSTKWAKYSINCINNKSDLMRFTINKFQVADYQFDEMEFKNTPVVYLKTNLFGDSITIYFFSSVTVPASDISGSFNVFVNDEEDPIVSVSAKGAKSISVVLKNKIMPADKVYLYHDGYEINFKTPTVSSQVEAFEDSVQNLSNGSSASVLIQKQQVVSIYPNPVINSFAIEGADNIESVEINSISGQTIKILPNPYNSTVPVSDLKTGVYFVYIHQKNGVTTKHKLIKI
jgi:hypothetical protein